jgi:hypothetical protein
MMRVVAITAALFVATTSASAVELKLFTVRAITTILWEIGPEFERTTGHKLDVQTGFSPLSARALERVNPSI